MPRRCSPGEKPARAVPARSTAPDAAEGSLRSSGEPSGVPLADTRPSGGLGAVPARSTPPDARPSGGLGAVPVARVGAPATADTMHGVVIVVIDGDTVLFKPDHYSPGVACLRENRLADIDAPENDQPYGEASTHALKARVLKRRAKWKRSRPMPTVADRAPPGDAEQVNAEMVRRGLAWAYGSRRASAWGRRGSDPWLRALQTEARRAQRGLWQDAAPTPPWVWRRARPPHAQPPEIVPAPEAY